MLIETEGDSNRETDSSKQRDGNKQKDGNRQRDCNMLKQQQRQTDRKIDQLRATDGHINRQIKDRGRQSLLAPPAKLGFLSPLTIQLITVNNNQIDVSKPKRRRSSERTVTVMKQEQPDHDGLVVNLVCIGAHTCTYTSTYTRMYTRTHTHTHTHTHLVWLVIPILESFLNVPIKEVRKGVTSVGGYLRCLTFQCSMGRIAYLS